MNCHMRSAAEITGSTLMPNANVMVQEFVLALDDLRKDPNNTKKLMDCVCSHYANNLNAPEFCSALQRRLTHSPATNKLIHQQPVNDSFILHNFYRELGFLDEDHSMMEKSMRYINDSFSNELSSIAVYKQRYSVFFTTAAMICAAVAPIVAVNAILHMSSARAGIAAAAAAFSILLTGLGKWRQSVLKKEETALKKHKQITEYMIAGAENGAYYVSIIEKSARRLDFVSKKMSEAAYDGKKVAAVENRIKQLLWKVEDYGDGMKWYKQRVIKTIIKTKVG
ncbi:hypothetical protein SASPL_136717 [Salvia splendens]|uniref:Uncharacterized protein n=1 Tax=Salvia splendens TaxID=180675 RepID=A0A8X8X1T1_SALSN|nr:hypothetical protein SASPL_136717 [Salvia splendens]